MEMWNIAEEAQAMQEEIIETRRDLHRIPEVGTYLPQTSAYIKAELDKYGIRYKEYLNGSGIVASIGESDHAIALRTDTDALAIPEETGLEFASENGNMHACGHDAHAAMMLGAARILKNHESELDGCVRIVFQPGEENFSGAREMAAAGVLKENPAEGMIGLHLMANEECQSGQVLIMKETLMAASDVFDICYEGKGAHGAHPELGVDPIPAAAQFISAAQAMVAREFSAFEQVVVSICSVKSRLTERPDAQVVYNAIPKYIQLSGTVRALDEKVRERAQERLTKLAEEIGNGFRLKTDVDYRSVVPAVYNEPSLTDRMAESCRKVLGEDSVVWQKLPSMGSEDIGYFLEDIPGVYVHLVSNDPRGDKDAPAHSSRYMVDESVLWRGTALLVQAAIDNLSK